MQKNIKKDLLQSPLLTTTTITKLKNYRSNESFHYDTNLNNILDAVYAAFKKDLKIEQNKNAVIIFDKNINFWTYKK